MRTTLFVTLVLQAIRIEAFCPSPSFTRFSPTTSTSTSTCLEASAVSRKDFLRGGFAVGVLTASAATTTTTATLPWIIAPSRASAGESVTLPSGVSYVVSKSGSGPKPEIGELAAIRFKASFGDNIKIDDIFDTDEPYYTRVGVGGLLKGVEEVLPLMCVGDRWILTIPSALAFGDKGRPASPGKPRVPAGSIITFEVEMVGLPGKEPELIELIGDV